MTVAITRGFKKEGRFRQSQSVGRFGDMGLQLEVSFYVLENV